MSGWPWAPTPRCPREVALIAAPSARARREPLQQRLPTVAPPWPSMPRCPLRTPLPRHPDRSRRCSGQLARDDVARARRRRRPARPRWATAPRRALLFVFAVPERAADAAGHLGRSSGAPLIFLAAQLAVRPEALAAGGDRAARSMARADFARLGHGASARGWSAPSACCGRAGRALALHRRWST
ncbi:MAG: hypothetical protein MZW92_35095 [Comamonadaceae bacterium]|nr:hypothetical protein [Comamonadaceae bacterium]